MKNEWLDPGLKLACDRKDPATGRLLCNWQGYLHQCPEKYTISPTEKFHQRVGRQLFEYKCPDCGHILIRDIRPWDSVSCSTNSW